MRRSDLERRVTAAATGSPAPSVQWQVKQAPGDFVDLAGATFRTGRAAAGAALRAATARLRRGEAQKKGFESDGGGGGSSRNTAIPGLR